MCINLILTCSSSQVRPESGAIIICVHGAGIFCRCEDDHCNTSRTQRHFRDSVQRQLLLLGSFRVAPDHHARAQLPPPASLAPPPPHGALAWGGEKGRERSRTAAPRPTLAPRSSLNLFIWYIILVYVYKYIVYSIVYVYSIYVLILSILLFLGQTLL